MDLLRSPYDTVALPAGYDSARWFLGDDDPYGTNASSWAGTYPAPPLSNWGPMSAYSAYPPASQLGGSFVQPSPQMSMRPPPVGMGAGMYQPPLPPPMTGAGFVRPLPAETMYGPMAPVIEPDIDGILRIGVNMRYRGRQSLLLSESAAVSVHVDGLVRDAWLTLVSDSNSESFRRYSRRLTGRVEAVGELREGSMHLQLNDPLQAICGTSNGILVFVINPSPVGQLLEASAQAISHVFSNTHRGRTVQLGKGHYGRSNRYHVYSGAGDARVLNNGYRRRLSAYGY